MLPIQWVFAIYALLTGLLAIYFSSADDVFSIHIAPRFLIVGWLVSWLVFKNKLGKRTWLFINMILPVYALGLFYEETQYLNQFLITFRDPLLVQAEQWMFGFQPSLAFSERFPFYWMVETMSFAYFSYYFIAFGFCLYVFVKRPLILEKLVFIVITSFLLFYSFFLLFPAAGPQFYFSSDLTVLPEGGFFQWAVRWVQSIGEGPTAAFPSSHVAMTIIILWLSFKHVRPVFYVVLPIFVLLCFSTVYIKAHYVVDVLVAFIAAPVVYKGSDVLWNNLERLLNMKGSVADSAVIIREVKTWEDLRDFIYLPVKIHKHQKSWTPPLFMDEWNTFNPKKNPAFLHCSTIRLVAFKNNEPVGRVLGIIHHEYNSKHGENNARFSSLEVPDDYSVFCCLIEHLELWARGNGCSGLVGPFGFSDKEPQGFVTEGFDEQTMMFANGNLPFMPEMMKRYNFNEFIRLVQYKIPINIKIIEQIAPFSQRAMRSGRFKIQEFTRTKDIKPFIRPVFDLINDTYAPIYGFSEVTLKEADDFANRFLPILNPRLIKMVLDDKGGLVGFVVGMPNLAEGLVKSRGHLMPFGWYHLLKANNKSRELVLLLGAIREDVRNRGVDTILREHLIRSAIDLGFEKMDTHLIMEDNFKMRREVERLDGFNLYKRYSIYSKPIQ